MGEGRGGGDFWVRMRLVLWRHREPDRAQALDFEADGGIGRDYPDDPLRGRDDDGPIFPIGDVDPRLPVQEPVLGVTTGDGRPVAFPVDAARRTLIDGGTVEFADITVELVGSGIRAVGAEGADVGSHQAFWFAWSQFHPDTELWRP